MTERKTGQEEGLLVKSEEESSEKDKGRKLSRTEQIVVDKHTGIIEALMKKHGPDEVDKDGVSLEEKRLSRLNIVGNQIIRQLIKMVENNDPLVKTEYTAAELRAKADEFFPQVQQKSLGDKLRGALKKLGD